MKFSIIIPVYNTEKYLSKLLKSILSQTYKNFEIIMVDDGSTDSSYEIMKNYSIKYNFIKSFHKNNDGPGLTRKYGFEKATGDLIFFADSDDYLANNYVLEKINDIFNKNNVDLILFNTMSVPKKIINYPFIKMNLSSGIHDIKDLDEGILEGCLPSKVFKKSIFELDFFYDSNNFEDVYTTYAYLNNCDKIYYLKDICYIVNRFDDNKSLTKDLNLNKFISSIDIILKISTFSKLNNSIRVLAMNYYMYSIRMLMKAHTFIKTKIKLISKLKELKSIFRDGDLILCKRKFKKKAYYYYLFVRIFI